MTCYNRLLARNVPGVGLVFGRKRLLYDGKDITVPCGKCLSCRLNQSNQWAVRAYHELKYSDGQCCFLTLTYNNDHLPLNGVQKLHLQLFYKRLRRWLDYHNKPSIRSYFACGEYGSKFGRPHYHTLIFGFVPPDCEYYKVSYSGQKLFISKLLQSLWPYGYVFVGLGTDGAPAYVARYSKKGSNTPKGCNYPFFLSSRNIPLSNGKSGAIGSQWLLDHSNDLRLGYVRMPFKSGYRQYSVPLYYRRLLEQYCPADFDLFRSAIDDYNATHFDGVQVFKYCKQFAFLFQDSLCDKEKAHNLSRFFNISIFDDIIEKNPKNGLQSVLDYGILQLKREEESQIVNLSRLKRH